MFSQFCDRMYAHIQKLHNDPAKTSWATDVIKCWQDCCVHCSNAAMQSQRWVFRTMSSLISQTEALTMLPRWVSCCSLDVRKTFFGKLTTVYWKRIFNPHFLAFPLARHEEVALQEAEVLWCYNKDELCCCLWFWCLAEFNSLWEKKTKRKDMSNHKILKINLQITASCCASTSLKRYVKPLKHLKVKLECSFFPSVIWKYNQESMKETQMKSYSRLVYIYTAWPKKKKESLLDKYCGQLSFSCQQLI